MNDYLLMTKFYNEKEAIPKMIENIAHQTKQPSIILFVNDGSTDNSDEIAIQTAKKFNLKYEIVSMPKKSKGNLDTLGRAWTKAQPLIKKLAQEVKYVATVDVDTKFKRSYFEDMLNYLENHPEVGVVAGQIEGVRARSFPMFTGKVVRSQVILSIDHYWDISIDSFINVKALKCGYQLKILDMKVTSPPSHLRSRKGRYRAGRLAYYAGFGLSYVLLKGILQFDSQYLRGYWAEWNRGTWQTNDSDILEYYNNLTINRILNFIRKLL